MADLIPIIRLSGTTKDLAMNTTTIGALRAFALAHNEVQFAHLCTAALGGERWAVERVEPVVVHWQRDHEWGALEMIRDTDTTRPDGAVPRSLEV